MHVDDALAYYLVDREGNSVSDINPKIADYHYQVYMSIVSQYEKSGVYAKDFYYRMFLNYFHVTSQIGKIENMDNYKEKAKLIEKTLQVCVKHRKEIKPYLKDNPIRKKIAYKLLLNPMTSHFAYLYFSKRIYNSTQKKKKIR